MPFGGVLPQTFPHLSVGATLVTFDGTDLGYAEDRVMVDERPQWEDIHNDAFGGMAGVPSEIQFLGAVVFVQANLNRFNELAISELACIVPSLSSMTGGSPSGMTPPVGDAPLPTMGAFMRQGIDNANSYFVDLVLSNAHYTLTFTSAFLRQGRKFNLGTRHQQVALTFECHITDPCDMIIETYSAADDPCS